MTVETVEAIETMLKNRRNGQLKNDVQAETSFPMRHWPQELRRLIDGDLPFNELHEAVTALVVAGELEEDVLAQIDATGEPWDQLRYAAALRAHYVARLVNLWQRIERGDEATIEHVLSG